MAGKKLQYKQIADPNLLEPLIKELEEVNKILGITADGFKAVIKEASALAEQTPLDSFENLKKVEKGIDDVTSSVKKLDAVEKERIKLQEKIQGLNDERVKANIALRGEYKQQAKAARDNAKSGFGFIERV